MLDMLVNLYDLPEPKQTSKDYLQNGIEVKRALALDKHIVLNFIKKNFNNQGWVNEAEAALVQQPSSCFIAVKNQEIIGFACYDATARGFFGPTGVKASERGQGLGAILLRVTLEAMREAGYGYAVIGWCDDARDFYAKSVGAIPIPITGKNVYSRMSQQ